MGSQVILRSLEAWADLLGVWEALSLDIQEVCNSLEARGRGLTLTTCPTQFR